MRRGRPGSRRAGPLAFPPRRGAREHLARGGPLGWFEALYRHAGAGPGRVPWADLAPNPLLLGWLDAREPGPPGRRALQVGCGLGDDAEALAGRGFRVVAFAIAPAAIAWCRRFPASPVRYHAADLFHAPAAWEGAFDFVLESYTLQALPPDLHPRSAEKIARGREPEDDPGAMSWPLTRTDLDGFRAAGLREVAFEDFPDQETPPVRRFRVEYRAPVRP